MIQYIHHTVTLFLLHLFYPITHPNKSSHFIKLAMENCKWIKQESHFFHVIRQWGIVQNRPASPKSHILFLWSLLCSLSTTWTQKTSLCTDPPSLRKKGKATKNRRQTSSKKFNTNNTMPLTENVCVFHRNSGYYRHNFGRFITIKL